MRVVVSTIIALVLVLGVVPAVGAQGGAKLTDVVICNEEAHRKAGSPSASARAGEKPRTLMPEKGTETDPSGSIIAKSPDPLLEGMAAEGLGDPAYRTAYRECMAARQKP
jgi:hypothetical protein